MTTILDTTINCKCVHCMKDAPFHPNYCNILQKILPSNPIERCQFVKKLYYLKPFTSNSWTKDWKSVTHRDFTFRKDQWSIKFPEKDFDLTPGFEDYVCRKWCKETHNEPLPAGAYTAEIMPNFYEQPRKPIYSCPRHCCTTYEHDYTWRDDYRPTGTFPGWCLRGFPPQYLCEDRTP